MIEQILTFISRGVRLFGFHAFTVLMRMLSCNVIDVRNICIFGAFNEKNDIGYIFKQFINKKLCKD